MGGGTREWIFLAESFKKNFFIISSMQYYQHYISAVYIVVYIDILMFFSTPEKVHFWPLKMYLLPQFLT